MTLTKQSDHCPLLAETARRNALEVLRHERWIEDYSTPRLHALLADAMAFDEAVVEARIRTSLTHRLQQANGGN